MSNTPSLFDHFNRALSTQLEKSFEDFKLVKRKSLFDSLETQEEKDFCLTSPNMMLALEKLDFIDEALMFAKRAGAHPAKMWAREDLDGIELQPSIDFEGPWLRIEIASVRHSKGFSSANFVHNRMMRYKDNIKNEIEVAQDVANVFEAIVRSLEQNQSLGQLMAFKAYIERYGGRADSPLAVSFPAP